MHNMNRIGKRSWEGKLGNSQSGSESLNKTVPKLSPTSFFVHSLNIFRENQKPCIACRVWLSYGAEGGTWTHTLSLGTDFESYLKLQKIVKLLKSDLPSDTRYIKLASSDYHLSIMTHSILIHIISYCNFKCNRFFPANVIPANG